MLSGRVLTRKACAKVGDTSSATATLNELRISLAIFSWKGFILGKKPKGKIKRREIKSCCYEYRPTISSVGQWTSINIDKQVYCFRCSSVDLLTTQLERSSLVQLGTGVFVRHCELYRDSSASDIDWKQHEAGSGDQNWWRYEYRRHKDGAQNYVGQAESRE